MTPFCCNKLPFHFENLNFYYIYSITWTNLTDNRIPLQLLTIINALWTASRCSPRITCSPRPLCVSNLQCCSRQCLVSNPSVTYSPPPRPPMYFKSLKTPNTFYIWKWAQDMWAKRHIHRSVSLLPTRSCDNERMLSRLPVHDVIAI